MANYGYTIFNNEIDNYFVDKNKFDDCGLNPSNLFSWGDNSFGQLGHGPTSTTDKSSPTQINVSLGWKQIAGGGYYAAGITTDGTLWTWGYDNNGQLDDLTSYPQPFSANTIYISGGAGGLFGGGSTFRKFTHVSAAFGTSPSDLGAYLHAARTDAGNTIMTAAGFDHKISIDTSGQIFASGRNSEGQLGINSIISGSGQIGSANTWKFIACGATHTHMIKTDGTLWATGNNSNGQLGDLTAIDRSSPVQISPDSTWKYVAGDKSLPSIGISFQGSFTIAIKTDGTLWATGNNHFGQLGLGFGSDPITGFQPQISSPVQIGLNTTWKQVACGRQHTLALKTNGTIWGWGRNDQGQVGDNTMINRSSPVQIGTKTNWRQVACSTISSYALASSQNYS